MPIKREKVQEAPKVEQEAVVAATKQKMPSAHGTVRRLIIRLIIACIIFGLLVWQAFAAVLPQDRSDAMYHSYQGGGMSIDGPSILLRKKIGNHVSVSANYYVDTISGASIDVLATASPYAEEAYRK